MARIILASASDATREQLSRLLSSSGFSAFRACSSGSDLRRAINECEDCIIIWAGAFRDCKPDELQWDYGDRVRILLIDKPPRLEECEAPVFRLALPVSGQEVIGAVEMLSQLHHMQMPKRQGTDKETIEQAKKLLMETRRLTEPEAHRELQRFAMNHGMKMVDCARQMLQEHAENHS